MKTHAKFLELAATAIDFPLAPADRRSLEAHLSACEACTVATAAMRRDASRIAAIPVIPLPDRRQAALLRGALRRPESHPLRLVAIAALLGLLAAGTLIVGAQLATRRDDQLSVVLPSPIATGQATAAADSPAPTPSASLDASTASPAAETEPPATPAVEPQTRAPGSDSVPIAPDSIGVVVTNDLRVRSKPEVSDASERLTPLLQDGQQVFVVDGPVSGSGYEWYLVAPISEPEGPHLPFGWVAAADKNGDAWLAQADVDCPSVPNTFATFIAVAPIGQPAAAPLRCFGDRSISFPARIMRPEATCGVDPGWTIEPDWLGSTCPHPEFLFFDTSGSTAEMRDAVIDRGVDTSRYDPGVEPSTGIDVVLTGQFDHPDARDCKVVKFDPESTPDMTREEAVLACRSQFVITDISDIDG